MEMSLLEYDESEEEPQNFMEYESLVVNLSLMTPLKFPFCDTPPGCRKTEA